MTPTERKAVEDAVYVLGILVRGYVRKGTDDRKQGESALAALTAILAEPDTDDERDAKRYRWLLEQQDICWQTFEGQWTGGPPTQLEDIIDAAIASGEPSPQEPQ
jgi:hypothetical protein